MNSNPTIGQERKKTKLLVWLLLNLLAYSLGVPVYLWSLILGGLLLIL